MRGEIHIFVDKGSISIGTPVTAIAVAPDGKAYIAVANEVKVYDLSDLSNPAEVDSFSLNVPIRSMAVNGNVLFTAAGADGLQVFDLSTPGKPATLATYEATGESLYIAGRRAYLAGGADGLQLLEVGPSGAAAFDVQVGAFGFVPHTITIHPGDAVRWISQGSRPSIINIDGPPPPTPLGGVAWRRIRSHSLPRCRVGETAGEGKGEGGLSETFHVLSANGSSTTKTERLTSPHTFNRAGTFRYNCVPSCSGGLAGALSVVDPLAFFGISITPPSIDFGNITVGTSSDQTFAITNTTTASNLTGSVGSFSAPFSVVSGGGSFGTNVLPGESVSVTVRFSPTLALAGHSTATLPIAYTLGVTHYSADVPLTGTGIIYQHLRHPFFGQF